MKVVAYIPAYNEADILPWMLAHLHSQAVTPYVLDNWSTDETQRILDLYDVEGERFPDQPTATYDWTAILQRIGTLAAESDADWCMLNDADELRYSPWPGVTLLSGFAKSQAGGCNCINFQVLDFVPTVDGYDGSQDPEKFFRFYEPYRLTRLPHIKAWRNMGRVNISQYGGHFAQLEGQQMSMPSELFLSKHYPIRSQAHGERKVFRDRLPRWNVEERAKLWHVQYQGIEPGHNFIRDPKDLLEWHELAVTA